jgi:hypothetical protein
MIDVRGGNWRLPLVGLLRSPSRFLSVSGLSRVHPISIRNVRVRAVVSVCGFVVLGSCVTLNMAHGHVQAQRRRRRFQL